jgi:hypothetical protein
VAKAKSRNSVGNSATRISTAMIGDTISNLFGMNLAGPPGSTRSRRLACWPQVHGLFAGICVLTWVWRPLSTLWSAEEVDACFFDPGFVALYYDHDVKSFGDQSVCEQTVPELEKRVGGCSRWFWNRATCSTQRRSRCPPPS